MYGAGREAARAEGTMEASGGSVGAPGTAPVRGLGAAAVADEGEVVGGGGLERTTAVDGLLPSSRFAGEGRKDSEARKDWPDPDLGPAEEDCGCCWRRCADEEDEKEVEGRKESRKEWLLAA